NRSNHALTVCSEQAEYLVSELVDAVAVQGLAVAHRLHECIAGRRETERVSKLLNASAARASVEMNVQLMAPVSVVLVIDSADIDSFFREHIPHRLARH